MLNWQALKSKVSEFVGGETDGQILASLNAKNLTTVRKIPREEVKRYLFLIGAWSQIKTSVSDSAINMVEAMDTFIEFDLQDALNLAAINAVLDGLIADPVVANFSATEKSIVLGMENLPTSWAVENYGRELNDIDLANARAWL